MKWYFEGGYSAHSCTLHKLGFRCRGENGKFRLMVHVETGKQIFVPMHKKLTRETRRQIVQASGAGRERYLIAWNSKPKSITCPKTGA
jgi:hypothetical protein